MFAILRAHKEKLRSAVRSTLLWVVVGCIGAIAVSMVGELFIKLAEEEGWYTNPSERVGRIMSAITWFFTSYWFVVPTAFVSGLTAGVWMDALLRRMEQGQPITARTLAQELDDLYAEGTRERNRLIPPIENFDYVAERSNLVSWKRRVLEKLDTELVSVAERSSIRTLRNFDGLAHLAPNKGEQQNQIEAMWNEHLTRLQAIIERLSGFPAQADASQKSLSVLFHQTKGHMPVSHSARVRAALADELSQIGVQATEFEWRENHAAILSTNRAYALINQISYDETVATLARQYIDICMVIANKRQRKEDDTEDRTNLAKVSKNVFKLLHQM